MESIIITDNNNNNTDLNNQKKIIMENENNSPRWRNATLKPNTKIENDIIINKDKQQEEIKVKFIPPTDIKKKFDKKNFLPEGPKDEFDKEFLIAQKMADDEDKKKKKKGIKIIKKLAEKNNVASQVWMAVYNIYDHTNDKKDINQGFKWAKKAADAGHFKGYEIIGSCYRLGKGTPVDTWKSIDCLTKSSDLGNANASNQLAVLHWRGDPIIGKKDLAHSFEYFLLAAQQGYSPMSVAECFYKGEGCEQNYLEAMKWFYIASTYGEVKSYNYMADYYYNIEQNYEKAFENYKKAEVLDTTSTGGTCFNSLGICYLRGHGTSQNLETAIFYFKKAIEKGNVNAQKNLNSTLEVKEKMDSRKSYTINIYS